MINPSPVSETKTIVATDRCLKLPSICWGAIIAGTVAAIGIQVLLTMLGLGAGLATFSPLTDDKPLEHFNTGAAIIWSLCALVSLWFGALLAGRFSHSWHNGFVHGILVWAMTLIITLLLLSKGTGMVLGGGLKVLGASMGIGAAAVSNVAGDVAKEGATRMGDQLKSFTEEAVQTVPTNSLPKASTRANRAVGIAVARLFAPGNDINSPANRATLVHTIMEYSQVSEADANTMVDGWIESYKNLKADLDDAKAKAEQKAKVMADQAARQLSAASTEAFFALLIGLIVSALAGSFGARCAVRHREETVTVVQP